MPLNATALKTLMLAKVDAAVASHASAGPAQRDAIFQAIAEAVVDHVTANAVVTVASVSGVTPGPGSSGSGVGSIS